MMKRKQTNPYNGALLEQAPALVTVIMQGYGVLQSKEQSSLFVGSTSDDGKKANKSLQ